MFRELNIVADMVDEALEILLSDDEVDRGPWLGCTSPEQSSNMFSHKANSMAYKQVTIVRVKGGCWNTWCKCSSGLESLTCTEDLCHIVISLADYSSVEVRIVTCKHEWGNVILAL